MIRRAARVDSNHSQIVKALRKAGCSVLSLAAVGNGCPDLLVCLGDYRGSIYLLEIKDGSKPPSRQKLRPKQVEFKQDWSVKVVTNEIEALRAVGL